MTLNGTYKKLVAKFEFLAPLERFSLFLAALARDDEETQIALGESCPTETWNVRERDYIHLFDVAQRLGDLVTFDMLTRMVFGLYLFDSKNDEVAQKAEDLLLSGTAIWRGFERFCDELGIPVDHFLQLSAYGINKQAQAMHPDRESNSTVCFEAALQVVARFEPDEEAIEDARRQMVGFWQHFTENREGKKKWV